MLRDSYVTINLMRAMMANGQLVLKSVKTINLITSYSR